MTRSAWCPEAVRLTPSAPGGTEIDFPDADGHMIWHTTESPAGQGPSGPNHWFNAMNSVLRAKSSEPVFLYDPQTDRLGQYFPAPQTGRALQNDGTNRTNRVGRPCFQIEVLGYASRPFTRDWKPGKNFLALGDFLEAWGVKYAWPSGLPPAYPTGHDERGDVYYRLGGHYGHSQVPGNSHGDPGQISVPELFRALGKDSAPDGPGHPGTPDSKTWPAWRDWPGYDKVGGSTRGYPNLLVSSALIVNGFAYKFTREVNRGWSSFDEQSLLVFKQAHGISEGGVGPETWNALGTMFRRQAPDFPDPDTFTVGHQSRENLRLQALMVLQDFAKPLGFRASNRWSEGAVKAVRRFQLSEPALRSDADGVPGPLTWKLAWTDNT